jgi:hypothetical protein
MALSTTRRSAHRPPTQGAPAPTAAAAPAQPKHAQARDRPTRQYLQNASAVQHKARTTSALEVTRVRLRNSIANVPPGKCHVGSSPSPTRGCASMRQRPAQARRTTCSTLRQRPLLHEPPHAEGRPTGTYSSHGGLHSAEQQQQLQKPTHQQPTAGRMTGCLQAAGEGAMPTPPILPHPVCSLPLWNR